MNRFKTGRVQIPGFGACIITAVIYKDSPTIIERVEFQEDDESQPRLCADPLWEPWEQELILMAETENEIAQLLTKPSTKNDTI